MEDKNLKLKNNAVRYIGMGDKILLSRFRERFYLQALKALEAITEQEEEVSRLKEETGFKLNEARAGIIIEKYEFACMSAEYAKTAEDQGSVAQRFTETAETMKTVAVDEKRLSEDCRKKYQAAKQAPEQAEHYRALSGKNFRKGRMKALALVAVCAVLAAGVLLGYNTPVFHQLKGKAEMTLGMNSDAADDFSAAYKKNQDQDTYTLYVQALYKAGSRSYAKEDYEEAVRQLHIPGMENYEDAAALCTDAERKVLSTKEVGSKVTFAGMSWIVLDAQDAEILLIKNDATEGRAFQEKDGVPALWAESSVREYLNGEFLENTFSSEEQKYILTTEVPSEDNPTYGTRDGEATRDQVYLLSISEYETYQETINSCGHCYWLRTPGAAEGTVSFVDIEKSVMDFGYEASADTMYLKPVIRVDLKQ